MQPTVTITPSLDDVNADEWDALVHDGSPFLEHAFLSAILDQGCATPDKGWGPRFVLVRDEQRRLVGAAPGWVKGHSMGEFVYDHGWADAARRAGFRYYPKLIVAVPFTPVTGQRLLVHPDLRGTEAYDAVMNALAAGLQEASRGCFGLHVLFDTEEECGWLDRHGLFPRLQFQFHWNNDGYRTFEDWLRSFPSDKRNKIRRERKALKDLTIEAMVDPDPPILDALHDFHTLTASQFGPWGHVYLSKDTFRQLGESWGHRLHAVVARDGDRIVGGAFNVVKGDRLYGRYWGCSADIRFLHFEVCYYKAIEDCIERGIRVFEPGHGGGQKYRRGFVPTITRSNHALGHPQLNEAFRHYTREEAEDVRARAAELTDRMKP